jgi:hypothetical protein
VCQAVVRWIALPANSGHAHLSQFGLVRIAFRSAVPFRRQRDGATSAVGFTARICTKSSAAEVCPTAVILNSDELAESEVTAAGWFPCAQERWTIDLSGASPGADWVAILVQKPGLDPAELRAEVCATSGRNAFSNNWVAQE